MKTYRFDASARGNPIMEGRLLAALQGIERVIVVGPEAASWAALRLENPSIHFVGGAERVPSVDLISRGWTGTIYGAGQILDYARAAGWQKVSVACTPAFAGVLPVLRAAARARGLTLSDKVVTGPPQVIAVVDELMGAADAFWALGGPLLTTTAGFDYIVATSLSRRVPVIVPEARLVPRGAYLAVEPDWGGVIRDALAIAAGAAAGDATWPKSRLTLAESSGRLAVNEVLKRKWAEPRRGGGR